MIRNYIDWIEDNPKTFVVFGFLLGFIVYALYRLYKINNPEIVFKSDSGYSYPELAEIAFNAMAGLGTDLESLDFVYNKIKSKDNFLSLSRAFGNRRYFLTGKSAVLGRKMNLEGWLTSELSGKQLEKWKIYF